MEQRKLRAVATLAMQNHIVRFTLIDMSSAGDALP